MHQPVGNSTVMLQDRFPSVDRTAQETGSDHNILKETIINEEAKT